MSINYDLQVTIGGYTGATLEDIIAKISPVIGLYPGYTYQRVELTGDVIHIYYSDDNANAENIQAEFLPAVPAIVWAILGVMAILGIAVIMYELKTVVRTAPTIVYTGLFVAGLFALGYVITATKKGVT